MASLPAPLPPSRREPDPEPQVVAPERLAECVRGLDPGTRALLDLSVRRRLRDDARAPLPHPDAFHLAWRRARALERVASEVGGDEPLPLAMVRSALEVLPSEAWDPVLALPAPAQEPEPASTELVPATGGEIEKAKPGVIARLDSFASEAP